MLWTKKMILNLIDSKTLAVERAVMFLFKQQELLEQTSSSTFEKNGRGFNSYDAQPLSRLACMLLGLDVKDISRGQVYRPRHLTPGEVSFARGRVRKYWRQLLAEANKNSSQQYRIVKSPDRNAVEGSQAVAQAAANARVTFKF